MQTKLIFSKKLAEYLASKSNRLLGTVPNLKDMRKKVFMFEDTEKLNNDMTDYINNTKQK